MRDRTSKRAAVRQGLLPFLRRSERLDRIFKRAILAATVLVAVASVWASPSARYAVRAGTVRVRWWALRQLGLEPPREEVEADRHRDRLLGVERTRGALRQTILEGGPGLDRFMKAARMDGETAVIRWGNYDQALVLSSDVFEPDDDGRSYRLRPKTQSIWLIGLSLNRVSCLFAIPCTDEARDAGAAIGGRAVPESLQTTNSWGCRGPEPDPAAPLRGLVLGDSVMQGLLVGDDETPPACLERELRKRTGAGVSVLNTGVLGYSMEQYYHALTHFAPRMRPHFVIVGICGNDFGPWKDPASWREGEYWLDKIAQFCRTRELPFLVVPYPGEDNLLGRRDDSVYPGLVSHILKMAGTHYLDPIEGFTNEELRLKTAARRSGHPVANSPLYNRHLMGDNHLSPLGSSLWARLVAERLTLIFDHEAVGKQFPPGDEASRRDEDRSAPDAVDRRRAEAQGGHQIIANGK